MPIFCRWQKVSYLVFFLIPCHYHQVWIMSKLKQFSLNIYIQIERLQGYQESGQFWKQLTYGVHSVEPFAILLMGIVVDWLEFHVLATSNVISGQVPTCDSRTHGYFIVLLQATSTMTWSSTKSHYPDTDPTSPFLSKKSSPLSPLLLSEELLGWGMVESN